MHLNWCRGFRSVRELALWVVLCNCCLLISCRPGRGEVIWVEGEKPAHASVTRHPAWYDKVQRGLLSGGDFISNWSWDKAGELSYKFNAGATGDYDLWVRANPVDSLLLYSLNKAAMAKIDMSTAIDARDIAEGDAIDLRFLAWVHVGKLKLKKGNNTIDFKMDSKNNHHGMLDCFVFVNEPFQPHGAAKPGEVAKSSNDDGWFAFDPPPDLYANSCAIDLRFLNEKSAGDGGFINVKDGQFVHGTTGQPVRFWGVNGPPAEMKEPAQLQRVARLLSKHGVNLVRIHGGMFNESGEVDPAKISRALDVVTAMKAEGIYCHFSTYFPLWLQPKADNAFLKGYDGSKNPFAALYFNPDFQQKYRDWFKALLTTPNPATGKPLVEEAAVSSLELINEDSYFFWTFSASNIPDAQLRLIESQYGSWLKAKYGSFDATSKAWGGLKEGRDRPDEGRIAFRPLDKLFSERQARDKDTAQFLVGSQRKFYADTYQYLRGLGFKGVITASNWTTASQQILGPLEKYSYTATDFIDRHGYFSCDLQGSGGGWSIREGDTYADRDALKFEAEEPGKPKAFVNTIMDPKYDGKPSMVSEITFNRPNRFRSEAPLYYAAYASLQGSNSIEHFALDGATWTPKPGYFVQPWTLMSPAMMGQFPAAAVIFRQGLIGVGDELVNLNLKISDLTDLKGTPLAQDAAIDELRLKDVPSGSNITSDMVIDPLVHFAGRTVVNFTAGGGQSTIGALSKYIDRVHQSVVSTNGQARLDYAKGILTLDAPCVEGLSGALSVAGEVALHDIKLSSSMELGNIVVVSLDGLPLATSKRMLLQVMSEEKPAHFQTEEAGTGIKRIVSLGQDPWMVKKLEGKVSFARADAAALKVTPLDTNGYPKGKTGSAAEIRLDSETIYYLVGG